MVRCNFFVFLSCTDKPNALSEPRGEEESLTKKGKKKKSVRWADDEQLKEYFYFDLDETERGTDRNQHTNTSLCMFKLRLICR